MGTAIPKSSRVPPPTFEIQRELERVLSSPSFRESKRCQEFLRYVVGMTISGRQAELKERTIGVSVFGRDPAYDTNDDSIVRVKANEIRRRLAQCNQKDNRDQKLRIEIPAGAYIPKFLPVAEPDTQTNLSPAVNRPARLTGRVDRRWAAVALAAIPAAAGAIWSVRQDRNDGLKQFWAPVLGSEKPVLISLAHPVVYHLSGRLHEQYRTGLAAPPGPGPYVIPLDPRRVVGEDIIPVVDQYVGVGDALAAVKISSMLRDFGRISSVRIGNDVSYSELRNSTAVLIGAYSNRWTLQLTDQLRFSFQMKDGRKVICDRNNPHASWELAHLPSTGKVPYDLAIVSRIFDSKTGNTLISCAGITQYGTQSGGEFLTDPTRLKRDLLAEDWSRKNVQFVIRAEVVGSSPSPPVLLAAHSW